MINKKKTLVVVGGGAAGFFAAINAKIKNPDIRCLIIEGTRRVLTKVKISGGGRCNVTHNCFEPKQLATSYPRGRKELLSAFYSFQAKDTITWFKERGVSLKAEKDGRMFPESNKSSAIIDVLMKELEKHNVELHLGKKITSIEKIKSSKNTNKIKQEKSGFKLSFLSDETIEADFLVLATGSSPSGYNFAENLGHTIIEPMPSLFTFNIKNELLSELMGQSFDNVKLELSFESSFGFKKYKQEGPLLITHWGLSGPAVLKLSAFAARDLFKTNYKAKLKINFVPSLTKESALLFLKNHREKNKKISVTKICPFSFSKRFWARLLSVSNIKSDSTWQEVSQKELNTLSENLREKTLHITGKGIFKEEFVTAGGVKLSEVDFKTMESKLCPSLYFCGEILNIDGITGGFNFQNAWTTAWLASRSF